MNRAILNPNGFLLVPTLCAIGIVSIILAASLAFIQGEANGVTRTTGRAQALYLAEAGLDAANDLLNQDWANATNEAFFPLQESVSVWLDGQARAIGEFEVTLTELSDGLLRLASTGRSFPLPIQGGAGPRRYGIERTLTMVVARKETPSFHRIGPEGVLELTANYFDKDGVPDLLVSSGNLVSADELSFQEGGQVLSSGSPHARESGIHLLAGFTDVDGDGDMDLLLSDAPSRSSRSDSGWIPTIALSPSEYLVRSSVTEVAAVLQDERAIPFMAPGWLFLPEGSLSGTDAGTEVFLNEPAYDGTLIVARSEL